MDLDGPFIGGGGPLGRRGGGMIRGVGGLLYRGGRDETLYSDRAVLKKLKRNHSPK